MGTKHGHVEFEERQVGHDDIQHSRWDSSGHQQVLDVFLYFMERKQKKRQYIIILEKKKKRKEKKNALKSSTATFKKKMRNKC